MPSLYCLGVTVDDKDFVRLFEGNLPSPEDRAAILNQPHSDRVREYVDQSQPQRREEHLGILDKGRYKISFDRQKRAAIIGVHTRSVGLEDAPVADFAGCLDDLSATVDWLLPPPASSAGPDQQQQQCIIHQSEGRWKRSRMLHLKAFVCPAGYATAAAPWRLPGGVGTEEALRQISARDMRYHAVLPELHRNHGVVALSGEGLAADFFPVKLLPPGDGDDQGSPAASAAAAPAGGAVSWVGSRRVPFLFAVLEPDHVLNGLNALQVRKQMLRMKAYLTSRGLYDFGFFMVPRFGPNPDIGGPAVPPPAGAVAAAATAQQWGSDIGPRRLRASAVGGGVAAVSGEAADTAAAAVCKLFVRGFRANPPKAAREDILRAVHRAGLEACMPHHIELLSDRIACVREGAALITLPDDAACTTLAQGLSGTEISVGFGACYVAGGALPPAPLKRGYYNR